MRLKTLSITSLATYLTLATLVACSSGTGSSGGQTTASPTGTASSSDAAPTLRAQVPAEFANGFDVAVTADQPPQSYTDDSGVIVGVFPDLVAAISGELEVPINVIPTSFPNQLAGIDQDKYGFITNTAITADREAKYDQVQWWQSDTALATLNDRPEIGSDPLDVCGKKIAGQTGDQAFSKAGLGDISDQCEAAGKPRPQLLEFPQITQGYVAVQSEQADATVMAGSDYAYFRTTDTGKNWKLTGPHFLPFLAGATFPKESALAPLVATALNNLIASGEYQAIMDKYGYGDTVITEAGVNPAPLS